MYGTQVINHRFEAKEFLKGQSRNGTDPSKRVILKPAAKFLRPVYVSLS